MSRYSFTATTGGGQNLAATADAESVPALALGLAAKGTRLQTVRELHKKVPRIRGIPYFEIIAIYRQIATSIEAGLPLVETLEMLSGESRNVRLKSLLYFLKSGVAEGVPLSEVMLSFPDAFPKVHVAVVKAGEESGRLDEALNEMADQAEVFSNMNRRFASALVYPAVIAVAALTLLNFTFLAIVPKWQGLFGDLGIRDYGPITNLVFIASRGVLPATLLVGLGVLILVVLIGSQRRAASGRLWLDSWKLRVPVIGQIVEKSALARFSGTLGTLLDAGVDLPRAILLASEGAGNRVVEHLLRSVSAEVELGESLGESLDNLAAMPPTLAWRVGVGEQTGVLPTALIQISRLYARQVDSLVTSLAGLIEPVLIVIIGSGVAMVVLGMFLPLVAVIQSLSGGAN